MSFVAQTAGEIASWVGVLITAFVVVGSAVGAVVAIRGSARELGRSIDALRASVDRLDRMIVAVGRELSAHNTRISRLEGAHAVVDPPAAGPPGP